LASGLEAYDAYLALLRRFDSDKRPFLLQLGGVYLFDGETARCPMSRGDGGDSCLDSPLCSCAAIIPYLLPDGALLPCMPMANSDFEKAMPNVFETPLEQALAPGSSYFDLVSMSVRQMFERHPSKCRDCERRLTCLGGCRAYALRAGNLYGPDPACCLFWNGGHYERFKKFFY
jgi:radical SAM protein with 4Fe4S-binding SPASM domain